jgi:hypothetical protein|tara:strand:- start:388 stop:591 length:204 start_codon:yes stop_codon:yes gene_type:complete
MKKNKLIVLSFSNGEKIAIKYTLKALDFIHQNFDYIEDFEIITMLETSKLLEFDNYEAHNFIISQVK